jgi:hypothetical protein
MIGEWRVPIDNRRLTIADRQIADRRLNRRLTIDDSIDD